MARRDPCSFHLKELAEYQRGLAAYTEHILAAHLDWLEDQPKKGRRGGDCATCRKRRWRREQRARKAERDG